MNHAYGERSYGKRSDDARIHSKNSMSHHPPLPGMAHGYNQGPTATFANQSMAGTATAGRSHSCSSPGSSASSICSTGGGAVQQAGSNESGTMYGENDFNHGPPPLINPRGNPHRYHNHSAQMSPVMPYSPGSQSSNNSVVSSPLPLANVATGQASSPSGSVSSNTDALPASPSVVPLDPAYRSVLDFVNQRWKEVQTQPGTKLVLVNNSTSCFEDCSTSVGSQQTNTPPASTTISRCTAPPQSSMAVP